MLMMALSCRGLTMKHVKIKFLLFLTMLFVSPLLCMDSGDNKSADVHHDFINSNDASRPKPRDDYDSDVMVVKPLVVPSVASSSSEYMGRTAAFDRPQMGAMCREIVAHARSNESVSHHPVIGQQQTRVFSGKTRSSARSRRDDDDCVNYVTKREVATIANSRRDLQGALGIPRMQQEDKRGALTAGVDHAEEAIVPDAVNKMVDAGTSTSAVDPVRQQGNSIRTEVISQVGIGCRTASNNMFSSVHRGGQARQHSPTQISRELGQEIAYVQHLQEQDESVEKYNTTIKEANHYYASRESSVKERISAYEQSLVSKPREEVLAFSYALNMSIQHLKDTQTTLLADLMQAEQKNSTILEELYPHGCRTIDDQINASMHVDICKHAALLTDITQLKLSLAKIEDDIKVARGCEQLHVQKVNDVRVTREKVALAQEQLSVIKACVGRFTEQAAQLKPETRLQAKNCQKLANGLMEIKATRRSLLWKWNPLGETRASLDARWVQYVQAKLVAQTKWAQLHYERIALKHLSRYCEKLAREKEGLIQKQMVSEPPVLASAGAATEQVARTDHVSGDGVHLTDGQAHETQSAVHVATYALDASAITALEALGVDIQKEFAAHYTGDKIQHIVHAQLVDSLNKIGSVQQTNPHIQHVLKSAVALNIAGCDLNNQHKVAQAMCAKDACDALIHYAKVVADVGVAVGEGFIAGIKSTAQLPGSVGKAVVNAATFPEDAAIRVRAALNNAVLKVSGFVAEVRKDITLLGKHDEQSLKEFRSRAEKRSVFLNELSRNTPLRDQLKMATQFFTECRVLGAVWELFFDSFVVVRQANLNSRAIENIVAYPEQVLAQEVIEIAAETIDKDPAVAKAVIEFAQKDAEFLVAGQRPGIGVGKQFTSLFEEPIAAQSCKVGVKTLSFAEGQDVVHFNKHSAELVKVLGGSSYDLIQYLADANHIIKNGTFAPELNGYVKLIGTVGGKDPKFGFVGLNRATNNITTFHVKRIQDLIKEAPSLGFQ